MSKIKMRCITCGKWFQSANAKEVTCPDCTQKARKEKLASKNAAPTAATATNQPKVVAPPPPPKPKAAQGGTNQWLDSLQDVKIAEPEQPPPRPKILPPAPPREQTRPGENPRAQSTPSAPQTEEQRPDSPPGPRRENFQRGPSGYRDEGKRGPGTYRPGNAGPSGSSGYRPHGPGNYRPGGPGSYQGNRSGDQASGPQGNRPRQPMEGQRGQGPRPDSAYKPKRPNKARTAKPAASLKPKREKIPPPQPFTPTEEQIKQVEERYIVLATPAEFDGIRTQIAHELGIPKKSVKKIIKDFRDNQHIPSWWEVQTYKGSSEELEKIKAAYLPYLPVPAVGIHKKIADELNIKPGVIYQAVKTIRLEMNLPQYNDPTFHEEELAAIREEHRQRQLQRAAQAEQSKATQAQQEVPSESTEEKPLAESTVESPEEKLLVEEKPLEESGVGTSENKSE